MSRTRTAEPYVPSLLDQPEPVVEKALEPLTAASVPAPVTMYEVFAALARDPSVDPAKLKQLMELQERAEERQAEKEFIAAFARLKFPPIKKTRKGHNSKYAPYEEIQEIIDPILAAQGFTLRFTSGEMTAQGVPIHGKLAHVFGHSEVGTIYLPRDKSGSMNEIQGMGSTTSYGQRYVAKMMLNLRFIGDDDDGNAVGFINERQVNNIVDMFAACSMDPASQSKFLELMKAETVGEIHARDYPQAMNLLNAKMRKVQGL